MKKSGKPLLVKPDKKIVITMAETLRMEGHPDYLKRTAEATGVVHSTIRRWLKEYREGKAEIGEADIVSFIEGEWAEVKNELAFRATQANRKVLGRIHTMLDGADEVVGDEGETRGLDTRALKDLAQVFQIMSKESGAMMGEQKGPAAVQAQQSTVNIVLPPKGEMPIEGGEIKVTREEEKTS